MLTSLIDGALFMLDAAVEPWMQMWRDHGFWSLVLLVLPVVLIDVPRMVISSVSLLVIHWRGPSRDDANRKRLFLAGRPSVSVIIAAYNESGSLARTIDSLLETRQPNMQIVVVDDNSTDGTYESVRAYADRGDIILLRNTAATGRGGKPAAVNLGLRFATGEFLVFVDADSSFDRELFLHLLGPFHDPQVGVVAGNIKVRNPHRSVWTAMQAIEYLLVIGLNKRWLDVLGMNYIASGACGAYRRTALAPYMGCDVETAEDLDNSLKVRRGGWLLRFAPLAVCMTDVPERLGQLVRQRIRWDRDLVRVAMRKHRQALDPRRVGWRVAFELWYQLIAAIGLGYVYLAYLIVLVWINPVLLPVMLLFTWALGFILVAVPFAITVALGERRREEAAYAIGLPFYPFYTELILRWVRMWANTLELFRLNQEDSYLPQSAWRNAPRW